MLEEMLFKKNDCFRRNMSICFFIGHRDIPPSILPKLQEAVERHITEYCVTEFVVGRYGSFDVLAAQTVREAKQRHPEIRLTLLLPYYDPTKPLELPAGFDGSLYPDGLERIPRRVAIIHANQYMIRHSNYLIAYDVGRIGNTRKLVEYARHREDKGLIHVENVAGV
ncbi:MAG: hypothetical protein Q4D81_14615 [Eubacteriales bacterium]|nr:hypothetical protein [Eubacteriales bacterium]